MFSKNLYLKTPWLSVRSALFADSVTKSPCQVLFHDILTSTREFLRGVFKSKSLAFDGYRKQHRLPVEYFKDHGPPIYASKFKLVSYVPGSIHRVTSRWYAKSLTNAWRENLVRKFYRGGSGPMICFVGFALAKKPSLLTAEEELEGVSYLIRDSFSTLDEQGLNVDKNISISNITLADLKIGKLIAKGCNAAIYSACICDKNKGITICNNGPEEREMGKNIAPLNTDKYKSNCNEYPNFLKDSPEHNDIGKNTSDVDLSISKFEYNRHQDDTLKLEKSSETLADSSHSQFFMPHYEGQNYEENNVQEDVKESFESMDPYDVALKVMFNYSAESNAFAIWNAMYKETLPIFGDFSLGEVLKTKVRNKKLKPHVNIVKMYSAFADQFPLLPGATVNFPQALPSRLLNDGCGRNMTLFVVMKRYHCCLKEYLLSQKIHPETSLFLFTQLLEALAHLFQNGVAHRDLKTDNILLDLSAGKAYPRLAIADFGCCLENLSLPNNSHDVNKGGNMTLMAPEVVNCEPGPFSSIDYSRADLWAAGAIAYEIFGGANPFYSNSKLKSHSYRDQDLPPFPDSAPLAIRELVMKVLRVNPNQRPSQNFAATVCQLVLHAPSSLLVDKPNCSTRKKAVEWMFQFSAETYLEASISKPGNLCVKTELKRTFCSRIQYLEVVDALQFILEA